MFQNLHKIDFGTWVIQSIHDPDHLFAPEAFSGGYRGAIILLVNNEPHIQDNKCDQKNPGLVHVSDQALAEAGEERAMPRPSVYVAQNYRPVYVAVGLHSRQVKPRRKPPTPLVAKKRALRATERSKGGGAFTIIFTVRLTIPFYITKSKISPR
jgi:hypothetical protein